MVKSIEVLLGRIQLVGTIALLSVVCGCIAGHGSVRERRPFFVDVSETDIIFRGTISQEAVEYLTDLVESSELALQRLVITSSGGDAEAGIDFGLLVHELGLDVYVPSHCGSSCANYVFTAGNRKTLSRTAFLMWHGGAMQEGLDAPPPCVSGGWYKDLLDCDAEKYARRIGGLLNRWKDKETKFLEIVVVDQRITILGQYAQFRCSEENLSGWYCSVADLKRLGVHGIEVLGADWTPVPPDDEARVCRVDLSMLDR